MPAAPALPNWDETAFSVVRLDGGSDERCPWTGSGLIIGDGSYLLTNAHVALSEDGLHACQLVAGVISSISREPAVYYSAVAIAWDTDLDAAVLRVVDDRGQPKGIKEGRPLSLSQRSPVLGEKLTTLSFPARGGSTITLSAGEFAGYSDDSPPFFKTTAAINSGGSGGGAFLSDGTLVGVITAITTLEVGESGTVLGLLRPVEQLTELIASALAAPTPEPPSPAEGNASVSEILDPRFGTCREAKQNGYGPYYIDFDQEYDWYWDRDNDEIVCE